MEDKTRAPYVALARSIIKRKQSTVSTQRRTQGYFPAWTTTVMLPRAGPPCGISWSTEDGRPGLEDDQRTLPYGHDNEDFSVAALQLGRRFPTASADEQDKMTREQKGTKGCGTIRGRADGNIQMISGCEYGFLFFFFESLTASTSRRCVPQTSRWRSLQFVGNVADGESITGMKNKWKVA